MSSEAFINGFSIVTMLQMSFISGAMFRISSSSVQVVAPVLGSRRADIVPPVMINATFGNCGCVGVWVCGGMGLFDFCFFRIVASRISFSRIPML